MTPHLVDPYDQDSEHADYTYEPRLTPAPAMSPEEYEARVEATAAGASQEDIDEAVEAQKIMRQAGLPSFMTPTEEMKHLAKVAHERKIDIPGFMDEGWDDEEPEIIPELVPIVGGGFVIYPGRSHSLQGPGGSGKTWFLIWCLLMIVRNDPDAVVMFIDYEDVRGSFKSRLRMLGARKSEVARIAYWSCHHSLMEDTLHGKALHHWCLLYKPQLVGLDSVSKACAAAGLDDEKNPQFQQWDNGVIVPLTDKGIATVRIDHTGHANPDQQGKQKMDARGASAKRDAVSGWSAFFKVVKAWSKLEAGSAELVALKDRLGTFVAGSPFLLFDFTPQAGGTKALVAVSSPDPDAPKTPTRYTWYMERISEELTVRPGLSLTALEKAVGKTSKFTRAAIADMIEEGYLRIDEGARNATLHTLLKPYSEATDPKAPRAEPGTFSADTDPLS